LFFEPESIVFFLSFFQKKLNSRNVYIWQHFTQKKNPNLFFARTGCVKNVYIWQHFAQNKTQVFFRLQRAVSTMCIYGSIWPKKKIACGRLCEKCVYMAPFCPKQKQICFT